MKNILFFGILLFMGQIIAQPGFMWAKHLGGSNNDMGFSVVLDAAGDVYTAGHFSGVVDFDPGPGTFTLATPTSSANIFITKFTAAGNFVWAKQIGGANTNVVKAATIDNFGNIYITGYFTTGTSDFDPGPGTYTLTSTGEFGDMFICKLDLSGNFIWAKHMEGESFGNAITVDASGNVYIAGSFEASGVDFDPGPGIYNLTCLGPCDIFLCKLDPSGNFLWAKRMGGNDIDEGFAISLDSFGNVYTTGYFQFISDFDPGPGTYTLSTGGVWSPEIFVSKLDASGNFLWARQMGGAQSDIGYGITLDPFGNIYLAGHFQITADFDPGPGQFYLTSTSYYEVFICKLNSSGNFVWAKQIDGTSSGDYSRAYSITTDNSGNVYTTGSFYGNADFDPGTGSYNLSNGGAEDIFISKLDTAGNFLCAGNLGGSGYDVGTSIVSDATNNIYLTGYFRSPIADFDPTAGSYSFNSAGLYDVFIGKYGACSLTTDFKETGNRNSISIYPNPSSGVFTINNENGTKESQVYVWDVFGNCVLDEPSIKNNPNEIDLSSMAKGMYFLEITTEHGRVVKKVVLQ